MLSNDVLSKCFQSNPFNTPDTWHMSVFAFPFMLLYEFSIRPLEITAIEPALDFVWNVLKHVFQGDNPLVAHVCSAYRTGLPLLLKGLVTAGAD